MNRRFFLIVMLVPLVISFGGTAGIPDPLAAACLAKATVELRDASTEAGKKTLGALLPANDPTVKLIYVPSIKLFEICVTDANAQKAAKRANEIVDTIRAALGDRFKVWERAEPPEAKMRAGSTVK